MFINFLVRRLQCTETLILYFEGMKKPPQKVWYFSKTAEIFSTTLTAQFAPKQKDAKFIWVLTMG